jgi:hypothetical protein
MDIEKTNGVHSKSKSDSKGKTPAQQYEKAHNLEYSRCDGNTYVDVTPKGKTKVLQE